MGLKTVLRKIWRTDAREPVRGFVDPSQVQANVPAVPLEPGRHYVRLYMRRFYLPYQRVAHKRYHAALVAEMELVHDGTGRAEFKKVIAPPELAGIPKEQRSNMKVDSKELAGPVPYRGEAISLTAGLLAVESGDLAGPFLATLEGIASAAGASYVAVAKPFLEPLGKGMTFLAEAAGTSGLKIGVDLDLIDPASGVYVMVDIDEQKMRRQDLTVAADFTLEHPTIDLRDYAHFVLSLEADTRRDDWLSIPDLKAAYDELIDAVKKDRSDEIDERLRTLERMMAFHPDLLEAHAQTLYEQIAARVERLSRPVRTRGVRGEPAAAASLPDLSAFDPFA